MRACARVKSLPAQTDTVPLGEEEDDTVKHSVCFLLKEKNNNFVNSTTGTNIFTGFVSERVGLRGDAGGGRDDGQVRVYNC